jgi:curli biogenesis system outer membrane secretion channel CsgG
MSNLSLARLSLCCCLVWGSLFGCSAGKSSLTPPVVDTPVPSPSVEPKMKIVVLRFENKTKKNKMDNSSEEDQLFGNGIKTQLTTALQQTGQFVILDNSGPRKVLWSRAFTPSGEIKKEARERLGSLGDAEFLVAGAITTYQLSQGSKAAGIDADQFLREPQAKALGVSAGAAEKVFGTLPAASQDRVVVELRLIDAKTNKTIDSTTAECTASDFGEGIGGLFGQQLVAASESTRTPMQRAVRVCAIKAVNWVADRGIAYRDGKITVMPIPTEPAPNLRPTKPVRSKQALRKTPAPRSRPQPTASEQLKDSPQPPGRPDKEPSLDEWGE